LFVSNDNRLNTCPCHHQIVFKYTVNIGIAIHIFSRTIRTQHVSARTGTMLTEVIVVVVNSNFLF